MRDPIYSIEERLNLWRTIGRRQRELVAQAVRLVPHTGAQHLPRPAAPRRGFWAKLRGLFGGQPADRPLPPAITPQAAEAVAAALEDPAQTTPGDANTRTSRWG